MLCEGIALSHSLKETKQFKTKIKEAAYYLTEGSVPGGASAMLQLLTASQREHTTYTAVRGAINHCLHPPQHTYFTPSLGGWEVSLHEGM